MMCKLIRIGGDAELRTTPNGDSVCSITGVYDIGFGDKKRSQWIHCAVWGKKAEVLSPYLKKGVQIVVYADDIEIEQYEHNGKTGCKLKCRVIDIDLTDRKNNQSSNGQANNHGYQNQPQQQPQPQQGYQQQQQQNQGYQQSQPQQQQNQGFNDSFDNDIAF